MIPVIYAGLALRAVLGPVRDVIYAPLFFVPSLLSLYVVRRPGAGVVAALFVGLVQVPFTPFGWTSLIGALPSGVASELPFLLTRYRRFGLPMLMGAGAVAGLITIALFYVPAGYQNLALAVQVSLIVGFAAGGAVLGGLLAKLLADAVARTGVLSAYPIGRRHGGEP